MGRVPWASEAFNCNAPDTGGMELLHMLGSLDQTVRRLVLPLAGDIRSCFAMAEPDAARSGATDTITSIVRDSGEHVIDGCN
jgi:acyl-CoA dehydrogenase